MVNYNNSFIYKLCCKDTNIKDIYIGSTASFANRKYSHRQGVTNSNHKAYHLYVYEFIRENGSWDNWEIVKIENVNCETKNELFKKEREWYNKLNPSLNTQVPCRTLPEYRKDKSKEMQEFTRDWRKKNPEKAKAIRSRYYEKNRESILEKNKKYVEKSNYKVECKCGAFIVKRRMPRHYKTKKHIKYTEENS